VLQILAKLSWQASLLVTLSGLGNIPVLAQSAQDSDLPSYPPQNSNSGELTVLAPTAAPEQLDRIVLNRLLQDITRDPTGTAELLGLDENLLDEIQISLANAASFINDDDMANIRAMCRAWDDNAERDLSENQRIELALRAYRERRQFTRDFISRFYGLVILEIESLLQSTELLRFRNYMNDRRRRLANAGNVVSGDVVENVSSGTETVRFHCRTN